MSDFDTRGQPYDAEPGEGCQYLQLASLPAYGNVVPPPESLGSDSDRTQGYPIRQSAYPSYEGPPSWGDDTAHMGESKVGQP